MFTTECFCFSLCKGMAEVKEKRPKGQKKDKTKDLFCVFSFLSHNISYFLFMSLLN